MHSRLQGSAKEALAALTPRLTECQTRLDGGVAQLRDRTERAFVKGMLQERVRRVLRWGRLRRGIPRCIDLRDKVGERLCDTYLGRLQRPSLAVISLGQLRPAVMCDGQFLRPTLRRHSSKFGPHPNFGRTRPTWDLSCSGSTKFGLFASKLSSFGPNLG